MMSDQHDHDTHENSRASAYDSEQSGFENAVNVGNAALPATSVLGSQIGGRNLLNKTKEQEEEKEHLGVDSEEREMALDDPSDDGISSGSLTPPNDPSNNSNGPKSFPAVGMKGFAKENDVKIESAIPSEGAQIDFGKSNTTLDYLMKASQPFIKIAKSKVGGLAKNESHTKKADEKTEEAKKAVVPPAGESESKVNAANIEQTAKQPDPKTRQEQAKQRFLQDFTANLPKKIKHVDKFKQSGRAYKMSQQATNVILKDVEGIRSTYGSILLKSQNKKNKRNYGQEFGEPDFEDFGQDFNDEKPETDENNLNATSTPVVPIPDIETAERTLPFGLEDKLVPDLKPLKSYFEKDLVKVDAAMKEQGPIMESQDLVSDPKVDQFKQRKNELNKLEKNLEPKLGEIEQQESKISNHEIKEKEKIGRSKMREGRVRKLKDAKRIQVLTKTSLEEQRKNVVTKIQNIYNPVEREVRNELTALKSYTNNTFKAGMNKATKEFQDNVDRRFQEFKDDRYSGWNFWKRGEDWLLGVNRLDGVKKILNEEKASYKQKIEILINDISTYSNNVIAVCKEKIKGAQTQIDQYIKKLPEDQQQLAEKAYQDIKDRITTLEKEVQKAEEELKTELNALREIAMKNLEEKVEEYKKQWNGVLNDILDFLKEIGMAIFRGLCSLAGIDPEAIIKFFKTLKSAAIAFFKDPAGFFKKMVKMIKGGFNAFFGGDWLQNILNVILEWIFGCNVKIDFSLKGILNLVLDVLGIGWDTILGYFDEALNKLVNFPLNVTTLIQDIMNEGPIAIIKHFAKQGTEEIRELEGESWDSVQEKYKDQIDTSNFNLLERFCELVKKVKENGISAVIESIKNGDISGLLSDLKDSILNTIKNYIKEEVVKAALNWLSTCLTGILAAIKGVYKIIVGVINSLKYIFEFISNVIKAAASNSISDGVQYIIDAIRSLIKAIIQFLADLIGIGDVPEDIQKGVKELSKSVRDTIKKVVDWIIKQLKTFWENVKSFFRKLFSGKDKSEEDEKNSSTSSSNAVKLVNSLTEKYADKEAKSISLKNAKRVVQEVLDSPSGKAFKMLKVDETHESRFDYLYVETGASDTEVKRIEGRLKQKAIVRIYPDVVITEGSLGKPNGEVYLFDSPSDESEQVAQIDSNDLVEVVSSSKGEDGWYLIYLGENDTNGGYVHKKDITLVSDEEILNSNKKSWIERFFNYACKQIGITPEDITNFLNTKDDLIKVLKNPKQFLSNLENALKGGFNQFFNTPEEVFIETMFAAYGFDNVKFDSEQGVMSILYSIIDINMFKEYFNEEEWEELKDKLSFETIWDTIKDQVGSVQDLLLTTATHVIDKLLPQAITQIVRLFIPGANVITALRMVYDAINLIIEKFNQFTALFSTIRNSTSDIINGNLDGAAAKICDTLINAIPLAVDFIFRVLLSTKIATTIQNILKKIETKVKNIFKANLKKVKNKAKKGKKNKKGNKDKDDKDDTDDGKKSNDPNLEAKAKAGMALLKKKSAPYDEGDGATRTDAEKIAKGVKRNPKYKKVFKEIKVVDGQEDWDFHVSYNPKDKYVDGPKKKDGIIGKTPERGLHREFVRQKEYYDKKAKKTISLHSHHIPQYNLAKVLKDFYASLYTNFGNDEQLVDQKIFFSDFKKRANEIQINYVKNDGFYLPTILISKESHNKIHERRYSDKQLQAIEDESKYFVPVVLMKNNEEKKYVKMQQRHWDRFIGWFLQDEKMYEEENSTSSDLVSYAKKGNKNIIKISTKAKNATDTVVNGAIDRYKEKIDEEADFSDFAKGVNNATENVVKHALSNGIDSARSILKDSTRDGKDPTKVLNGYRKFAFKNWKPIIERIEYKE